MPVSPRSKEFDLRARVESILSGGLGALPRGSYLTYRARVGIISGPVSGVVYALLFAEIPWFIPGTPRVILELALQGAVYFALAAMTAQLTSGRRVLFFWTGIAAAILTLYPLFYRSLPYFVLLVVPIASFFSLAFGTIIFLASEFEIGRAVNGVLSSTLRSTEQEIAKLLGRADLTEAESGKLKDLMSLHEKLSTSGWYQSMPLGVLSVERHNAIYRPGDLRPPEQIFSHSKGLSNCAPRTVAISFDSG